MPPPKTRNSKLNEQDEMHVHEEDEHDEHQRTMNRMKSIEKYKNWNVKSSD